MGSTTLILKIIFYSAFFNLVHSSNCTDTISSTGTHFLFGIPKFTVERGQGEIGVFIGTSSPNDASHVLISAPCINYIKNYTVYGSTTVRLPIYPLVATIAGSDNKGIEIVSDRDISVLISILYSYVESGALLLLPVQALSTRYIVSSYEPSVSYNNSILIVGVTNDTKIEISNADGSSTNFTQTTSLHKFDTFQIISSNDTSGAVITSNKPVAVFSGSERSKIPVGEGEDNYLVGQMIPTNLWTNKYIVPSIYPHNFYIVRIFADHDDTRVNYFNSTTNNTVHLPQGMMLEIMFGSAPTVIVSNKPISVVQYFADNENMYGNPYMIISQGLSQFAHQYNFYCYLSNYGFCLAITIPRGHVDGLRLDGDELRSWETVTIPVPYPFDDYVTIFYNMSGHTGILEHKGGVKFGAVLYSLAHPYYGYGSALKLTLSTEISVECPTSVPDFSTNAFSSYHTVTPTVGTRQSTSPTSYNQGNKSWCFQCEDMSHLQYCDIVTECNTGEVCFVEKYAKSRSLQLYKSGCLERSMCQHAGVNAECQQCCNGSFCNIEGCGDNGVPAIGSRGPFCFACGHHGEDDICRTVQMCAPDQLCKTEMYVWGGGHHFIKGCADQQTCRSKREMSDIESRSTPTCLSCCKEDFCNTNCTVEHGVALVG